MSVDVDVAVAMALAVALALAVAVAEVRSAKITRHGVVYIRAAHKS